VREHARTIYGIVMIVKIFLIDKDEERQITYTVIEERT
jgi:hypothetical protein